MRQWAPDQEEDRFDYIVVLTTHYPFEHGEAFLESEINCMKKYAKKVIFLPIGVKKYVGNRIEGNDNVVAITGLRAPLYIRAVYDWIGVFNRDFWIEYKNFRGQGKSLFNIFLILDYNAQFYRLTRIIKNVLSQYIKDKDSKILFYSYWLGMSSQIVGELKTGYRKALAVSRAHAGDIYGEEQGMEYVPYRNESVSNLDAIFSVSTKGEEYLKSEFRKMEKDIFCSRLGTIDNGYNRLDSAELFTIVSCSSLVSLKRVHLLIRALSFLKGKIRWIHFGDGELRATLEQQAKELPEFVQWEFRGQISNEALMKTYRELSIDMFINVSSSEGIPVSIMEALSFGIPVMATDVGGTKEAVIDGYNGKLLPAEITPAELAQAIMDFREELELSGNRYRNNARKSWEKNYSAEKNYTDFYEKVCVLHREIYGKRNNGA